MFGGCLKTFTVAVWSHPKPSWAFTAGSGSPLRELPVQWNSHSLWDVGGIGWMIQEVLGWEEAPWTVGINGRSRKQRHWEVWEGLMCGCWKLPVVLGGAGWPKGSLLPTERTTVMLSDVPNPVRGSLLPY